MWQDGLKASYLRRQEAGSPARPLHIFAAGWRSRQEETGGAGGAGSRALSLVCPQMLQTRAPSACRSHLKPSHRGQPISGAVTTPPQPISVAVTPPLGPRQPPQTLGGGTPGEAQENLSQSRRPANRFLPDSAHVGGFEFPEAGRGRLCVAANHGVHSFLCKNNARGSCPTRSAPQDCV